MTQPDASGTGSAPGGEPGTKTCPFCAETIRAAAVKCRYCQSDLTGSTPQPVAPPGQPGQRELPESTGVLAVSDREGLLRRARARLRGKRGLPSTPRRVWAPVVVLCLVLIGLAAWQWQQRRELERAESAGQVARAAVSDKVEALLSYSHETFDEDVEAAQALLTPSFREEYAPTVSEIRSRALRQQRDQQAEVLAVGLVSAGEDRVRTLVFVNTVSAREESTEPPTIMQNRVTVDLVRISDGDEWLIDDFSFPSS